MGQGVPCCMCPVAPRSQADSFIRKYYIINTAAYVHEKTGLEFLEKSCNKVFIKSKFSVLSGTTLTLLS